MIIEPKGIIIEKEDRLSSFLVEGNKPEITIKDTKEKEVFIRFDNRDTFEYFSLKLNNILKYLKTPLMRNRLDTARMQVILLNKELNKIHIK